VTGPGRPPVGPVVKVRLEPDMLEAVDDYARRWDVSRAEAIRDLLKDGLLSHS